MTARYSRLFLRHSTVSGDTHCTSATCVWSLTIPLFHFTCSHAEDSFIH